MIQKLEQWFEFLGDGLVDGNFVGDVGGLCGVRRLELGESVRVLKIVVPTRAPLCLPIPERVGLSDCSGFPLC